MGVHPKVFPDCMHTSVSNLVQHGQIEMRFSIWRSVGCAKRLGNEMERELTARSIVLIEMQWVRCPLGIDP